MVMNVLLISSVLLQLAAAVLALRLIKVTGRRVAWGLVAIAIFLMTVRRAMSFTESLLLHQGSSSLLEVPFEVVGLITSLCMLLGIYWITPLFESIRRSEEALKESNRKLSELSEEQGILIDHTLDMVYRHNTEGIFTFVSPAVEKITGYSVREWLTHYETYLTDNPINKKVAEYTQHALRTGEAMPTYVVELYHKDGRHIFLEVNEQPHFENSKVAGIIGVARDVTERQRLEREREKLVGDLQEALARIKTLRGLIPICAWCKKIRDDKGYWTQVESYIKEHSDAEFSHGICPECYEKVRKED